MKFKILNDSSLGAYKAGEIGEREGDGWDESWSGKYHCSLYLGDVMAPALFSKDKTPLKHRRVFYFHFWEIYPILSDLSREAARTIESEMLMVDRVEALRNRGHVENIMAHYGVDENLRDEVAEAIFRRIIERLER